MWDENDARDYELAISAIPSYWPIQHATVDELVNHFARTGIKKPVILEIGCGTGNTTDLILSRVKYARLTCVDQSEDMIAVAKSRFTNMNITFIRNDGRDHLDRYVADNSFDAIVTAQTLHNIVTELRSDYYPEISRGLKIGGIFLDGDKFAQECPASHYDSLRAQMRKFCEVFGKANRPDLTARWVDHYLDDNQPHKIFYESEFMEKCREFGVKPRISHRVGLDAVGVAVKMYDA